MRSKATNWFIDKDSQYRWIYHRVKKHILSTKTQFQRVEIIDTYEFGRVVILDDKIQSAEADLYYEYIPSFGTLWAFIIGSSTYSPKKNSSTLINKRIKERRLKNLLYYGAETHERLFKLPKCIRKLITAG